MKTIYTICLSAILVGTGLRSTPSYAQDDRSALPIPLPPVTATAPYQTTLPAGAVLASGSPTLLKPDSHVVAASFASSDTYNEGCEPCNEGCEPSDKGCEPCDKFAGCGGCCNNPSGYKFKWAPDRWVNAAVQIRSTFNSTTGVPNAPGAGNTAANSLAGNFFAVNNARLLFSGQVHEVIGFELNTEMSNAQIVDNTTLSFPTSINLLDAIVKYSGDDLFNIWAGQFLPPSDRSLLDGPFFINAWDFPFTSNYPNVFQGREIGAAYWGQLNGGMLQWSAGVFNGSGRTLASPSTNGFLPSPPPGPPNPNGRPLQFAARVTLDLLDPEPGYYKQSTYYGQKDILAIGFAIQTQARSVGTAAGSSNFTGLNADILFEKKLDNDGVFTAEGAFYNYDNAGLATSSQQGESGFIYTGYLMPRIFGFGAVEGRFRPYARYQQYNHDFLAPSAGLFSRGTDVGTDYIINGHNARLTAFWGDREVIGTGHINLFRIGAQVVF